MDLTSLDRLGGEIVELSAHLEAATARLLDLIRGFDARGGRGNGFRSCAAWLAWRVGLDPGAARERVRVARALGALPLPTQALARGDASRVVMRHGHDGRVVEVAARTRTIPPAVRRALHHRDRGCRFPGCGLPFGQGHHIRHWAQGGPTTLSNLALPCRRHHRAVHEEGYQVARQPDGSLRFRRPDGHVLPEAPRPPEVPVDPVRVLRARHEAAGLRLHAPTTMPAWLGEPLDVGYAIDVLQPLARSSQSGVVSLRPPVANPRPPAACPS